MNLAYARFALYLIAALTGAVIAVIGAVGGDGALVATGIGLVTTGGLAAGNTPLGTGGDHAAG